MFSTAYCQFVSTQKGTQRSELKSFLNASTIHVSCNDTSSQKKTSNTLNVTAIKFYVVTL